MPIKPAALVLFGMHHCRDISDEHALRTGRTNH